MHRKHKRVHNPEGQAPYWKRAHKDWRFIIAVSLMLIAITTYVMSDDLAWQPRISSLPEKPPA